MADHGPRVAWLMLAAVSAAVGGLASSRSGAVTSYDCVRIAALLSGSATSSMGSWSGRRCCCAGPTTERGRRRGVRTWRRRGEGLRAIRLNSSKRREEGKGESRVCVQRGVGPQLTETIRRQSGKRIKMHQIVKLTQRDRLRRLRQSGQPLALGRLPRDQARLGREIVLECSRDGRLKRRDDSIFLNSTDL